MAGILRGIAMTTITKRLGVLDAPGLNPKPVGQPSETKSSDDTPTVRQSALAHTHHGTDTDHALVVARPTSPPVLPAPSSVQASRPLPQQGGTVPVPAPITLMESERLGKGGYGSVHRATVIAAPDIVPTGDFVRDTLGLPLGKLSAGMEVAAKTCEVRSKKESAQTDALRAFLPHFELSCAAMADPKAAGAQNITRFYGAYLGAATEAGITMVALMEALNGSSLDSFIGGKPLSAYSVFDQLSVLESILAAVAFCHAQGIAHCDIKPANLMLAQPIGAAQMTASGQERCIGDIKLIDFDLAVPADRFLRFKKGTKGYMAPEILAGGTRWDPKQADIFAAGQTFLEVWEGKMCKAWLPLSKRFQDRTPTFLAHLASGDFHAKRLAELVGLLMHPSPEQRPTARDALQIVQGMKEALVVASPA